MVHEGIVVLDGEMLRPETPLDLDANRRYRVILMPLEDAEGPTAQPARITLGELTSFLASLDLPDGDFAADLEAVQATQPPASPPAWPS